MLFFLCFLEDGDIASGYEDNGQLQDKEDDEGWAHVREPSGYYVLDFSVVRKEGYHN